MKNKIIYSPFFAVLVHFPVLVYGIFYFRLTGKTPYLSYWSMRKLYRIFGDSIMEKISRYCSPYQIPNAKLVEGHSSLFDYTANTVHEITAKLEKHGYAILPFVLPNTLIENLERLALKASCTVRQSDRDDAISVNIQNPIGPRYDIQEEELLKNSTVLNLVRDPLFLEIAANYLKCTPVNDMLAMWWNFAMAEVDTDLLAQMYHSDLDRPKFLKFFFYLTDVDENNGPHCFIEGSHKDNHKYFKEDRRFNDDEVYAKYGRESEIMMLGKRGLILAEDTKGLHKGLPLKSGYRLMFQIEYASTLFGQDYEKLKIERISLDTYAAMSRNPLTWQRFLN